MNPPTPIICNTTILSNFAAIQRVALLPRALARPLLTTPEVLDEIRAGVQAGYPHLEPLETLLLSDASPIQITHLTSDELTTPRGMRLRLHAGEASCLAIALHRGYTLGTDDLAARKIAQTKNIPLIGTVGALALCRHGLLSLEEANTLLERLIDSGYRSPTPRLDNFWT
ncbi:MAG: hypothetical protein HY782_16460 [Chloroflexi bacterium]|nr:hypothetical protein [Chloroflexota bacterium]